MITNARIEALEKRLHKAEDMVVKGFRDMTAMQTLLQGRKETDDQLAETAAHMHRIALTIDARFAMIENRLKVLEERQNEILQRVAGYGRVVQATQRSPDNVELPPDSHPEGGAV